MIKAMILAVIVTVSACAQSSAETTGPEFIQAAPLGLVINARPGSAEVLDLNACVEQALSTNDLLVAERLRRAELSGQMKQALSTGLPTLDLVGDWSRSRNPAMALDSTFGGGGGFFSPPGADPWFNDWLAGFGSIIPAAEDIEAQSFWRANLNLNWTINPTLILGAVGAASLGVDRQELQLTAVEQGTADRTLVAYYGIIKAAEKIRAVEAELINQTELVEIMQMRYDLGMATRLDTLQAAVTRANIVPRLSIAEASLRNEGSRLNALMGRRPEAPLSIANDHAVEDQSINDEVALRLAQRRPELVANGLFVDILRKNRQAQKADNMPYITLFGSYGYIGTDTGSLFDDGHDSWQATVALNIPVFDGLSSRGRVAETEATIRRTEAELTGRRREVQVEVLEIMADLSMARQVLSAVTLNLERSEDVLDESLLMLQLGKVNYLDVLVAESNRAEALSNVIDARYNVLVLTSALKTGLGYSPLLPLTAIPQLVVAVAQ